MVHSRHLRQGSQCRVGQRQAVRVGLPQRGRLPPQDRRGVQVTEPQCLEEEAQAEPQFVILWETGAMTLEKGQYISRMYDLADCDSMEGVKDVLVVNAAGELVPVTVDPHRWRDTDADERSIVYAYSAIMAGKCRVGTVAWTDH